MTYRPKHFTLSELVDPWFIANHTEDECWDMLDEQALRALQAFRDRFGRIVVNGFYKGHTFTESGLRRPDTKTGAKLSMHKKIAGRKGSAFDMKFKDTTEHEVYNWIIANQSEAYAMGVRRVESIDITGGVGDGGWLHFDNKDTGIAYINKIKIVKPSKKVKP